ncbi:hypothetical protein [Modicisalibacter tunisiensis]|uniref:Uncharacterized protein n=1 Tax=Modicisalibacter tunisiensis TaxID=390637 RepID=A0ABS7WWT0_9GAMM|nr:hypothetical protein [Modicisalibacter tunisiensis]MBZ9567076.1 hypothetical protein [Modicisalibacter tunisiensis]
MSRLARFARVVALGALGLIAIPALAQPAPADAEWNAYLDALEGGAQQATLWRYGWGGIYAASLADNAYQASEADGADDRFDARVGGIKSALALAGVITEAQPHPAAYRRLQTLAEHRDAAHLAEARALMRATAAEERRRRAWRARLSSLVINTLGGLAIGVGDDRPRDGAVSFATGMLVGEIQLRTQPGQAGVALNRFQPARLTLGGVNLEYQYAWTLAPDRVGVQIRY